MFFTFFVSIEMINTLISRLASGNGMLFTGAGFSMGATNILGGSPPRGRELVALLKRDGGMEELEIDDLDVVVDVYLSENSPERLIKILRDNYTIRDVSDDQKNVAMVPWRRCYTTNYDEVFEKASNYSSNLYKPITLSQSIEESYENGKVCVHVNGFIGHLNKNTIHNEFKLSESSYSSGGFFNESQWYCYFNKDLEQSACIVLIGYSLYDYEFRKLFYDDTGNIKDKIFIITSENASEREVKFFEKYGNVLKVGLNGFSNIIKENLDKFEQERNRNKLTFFKKNEIETYERDIILNDKELEDFLVFGNLSDSKIIADLNSNYNQLVIRKEKNRASY